MRVVRAKSINSPSLPSSCSYPQVARLDIHRLQLQFAQKFAFASVAVAPSVAGASVAVRIAVVRRLYSSASFSCSFLLGSFAQSVGPFEDQTFGPAELICFSKKKIKKSVESALVVYNVTSWYPHKTTANKCGGCYGGTKKKRLGWGKKSIRFYKICVVTWIDVQLNNWYNWHKSNR